MHQYIKLLILLTVSNLFLVAYAQDQANSVNSTTNHPDTAFNLTIAQQSNLFTDSLIRFAKRYLGKPYHYRPNPSIRFDCSGFSSYVYDNFGFKLKRSSAEQATQFGKIEKTELKPGDLVFFSGRRINNRVGHVGIVVNAYENGKFHFIHSSNQSGIVISHSDEYYYARRYIRAGRVIDQWTSTAQKDSVQHPSEEMLAMGSATQTEANSALPEPPSVVYHHVKKGDNLYSIAKKHGITVNTLKKQNKLSGDKIMPGQKLVINLS